MSADRRKLAGLRHIAQLRADTEMQRLAHVRGQLDAATAKVAGIRDALEDLYQSEAPFSVEQSRIANALAGSHARALLHAEAEVEKISSSHEVARKLALREFGRSQALRQLQDNLTRQSAKLSRRSEDLT